MFYLVLRDQNSQAATFFNEEGAEKKKVFEKWIIL
jgi:hypothetical protein